MKEGSLEAPVRHPIDWTDPDFVNHEKLDAEMRRVFDICHGCRRCFNLCDSFPRLFNLIDESETGELDSVDSADFQGVVDACTMCDLCFMTKCPYVPPHEFNLDFPHLMLRYRAVEFEKGKNSVVQQELAKTDRNGMLGTKVSGLANWASNCKNPLTRPVLEKVTGIDRKAAIPKFSNKTFLEKAKETTTTINKESPHFGRKVVLFSTCFSNYNKPEIGLAALKVLAKNGIKAEPMHPGCCGMPHLEQGNIKQVAEQARLVSQQLREKVEAGYDVVSLIPSCSLMLKFEWPLILPEDENVKALSKATFDISEYIVKLSKEKGLAEGLSGLSKNVTIHISCHSRAQNIGPNGAEMLRLIPDTQINVIERCSGHGGTWGMMKDNFEIALKVGRPVAKKAQATQDELILSECPLAGEHILQGIEMLEEEDKPKVVRSTAHPIEILAQAYGD